MPHAGPRFPECTGSVRCHLRIVPHTGPLGIFMMDLKIVGAGATVDETGLPLIRDDRDINTQPPSDLDLTWRDAVFSGRHWLLGPIWLTLSSVGTSSIRLSSVSSDQDQFFPARSESQFYWTLEIPRWHMRFENADPMVTVSIAPHLLGYPVERAWYSVESAVRMRPMHGSIMRFLSLDVDSHSPVSVYPSTTSYTPIRGLSIA